MPIPSKSIPDVQEAQSTFCTITRKQLAFKVHPCANRHMATNITLPCMNVFVFKMSKKCARHTCTQEYSLVTPPPPPPAHLQ